MPDNVKDKLVTLEALKLVNDINLPKDLSELDSVPNEVTVSSTDIIAMQVDGTTYKLPVSALASALKSAGNYITSSEVANDLTTSSAGKVLDARQGAAIKSLIDSLDLSDVSEAHENTSWKSAPIGMSHYYYDEVDASTTYGVPVDNCFVVVMRSDGSGSQSRGVALAFRWTRGSTATTSSNDIWMSTLQDEDSSTDVDWFAWTQISYDTLPVEKGGTNAATAAAALSNLGGVSKTGDTMSGTLRVNSSNAIQLRLGQGGSYNSQVAVRAYANNTSSRTDFIQVGSNGTNYEYYSLPDTQASVSSNTQYHILTSKTPVTIAQGGTGSTTASGARSVLTAASVGGNWTQAPVGVSYYSYETSTLPTDFTIPFNFCDVYVFKRDASRGTAIAVRWNRANPSTNDKPETDMWMSSLHDTWSSWRKISWTGAIPVENGGTGSTTAANARTALGVPSTGIFADLGSSNIDNVRKSGLYYVAAGSSSGISGEIYGGLIVMSNAPYGDGNRVTQVFIPVFDVKSAKMRTYSGSWGSWVSIHNSGTTIPISAGGTGQTTAAAARNALGLGNTTGALPIANGGTGQTTVAAARNALGLGNTSGALPIANGGTGQTTAAAARNALGLGNTTGALPIANGGTGNTKAGLTGALSSLGLHCQLVNLAFSNGTATFTFGEDDNMICINAVATNVRFSFYRSYGYREYTIKNLTNTSFTGNVSVDIIYLTR